MQKEHKNYSLSNKADKDISSIAYYTIEKFGLEQARTYRDGLVDAFRFLALKPTFGKVFILNNGISVMRYRYKSHVIFFKKKSTGIHVLRILGGKMNFEKHF